MKSFRLKEAIERVSRVKLLYIYLHHYVRLYIHLFGPFPVLNLFPLAGKRRMRFAHLAESSRRGARQRHKRCAPDVSVFSRVLQKIKGKYARGSTYLLSRNCLLSVHQSDSPRGSQRAEADGAGAAVSRCERAAFG